MKKSLKIAYLNIIPMVKVFAWVPFGIAVLGASISYINNKLNPFDGFSVSSVSIPDHCQGDNPTIRIERTSKKPVKGMFFSRCFRKSSGSAGAYGKCNYQSVIIDYKQRFDSVILTDLNDYLRHGAPCDLPPNTWECEINWRFMRPWHDDTAVSIKTNTFTVWDRADPKCKS